MSNLLMGDNPLSAILAFFVVLIPLILVHELGHFLAAKAVGISILEFAIGFPPRIVKVFTWGETDFTLNWIPLGGYVRPLGEDMIRPLDQEGVEKDREELRAKQQASIEADNRVENVMKPTARAGKTVNEAKPLPRIFFMAAGALANFILAFFLFTFVALSGIPQIVGSSVFVNRVEPDSVFSQAGLQNNDFILEVNGQNFVNSQEFWSIVTA
jgi:regulator of sigma E protease